MEEEDLGPVPEPLAVEAGLAQDLGDEVEGCRHRCHDKVRDDERKGRQAAHVARARQAAVEDGVEGFGLGAGALLAEPAGPAGEEVELEEALTIDLLCESLVLMT